MESMTDENACACPGQTCGEEIRRPFPSDGPSRCRDRRTGLRLDRTWGCALGQAYRDETRGLAQSCAPERHAVASRESVPWRFASARRIHPLYKKCLAKPAPDELAGY